MSELRFSVIVLSRDSGAYLERALCSVLDQPWEQKELLVVDGGSRDGSDALLARYTDELTWWRSASDSGPAEAINDALQRATGDVVGILPAGDLYLPETLAHAGAWFAREAAPDWLASQCMRIGPGDEEIGRAEPERPASLQSYLMHASGLLPQAGVFYRRQLLEAHGPFDVNLRYAYAYELHARLLAAGVWPTLALRPLAAQRERGAWHDIDQTLRCGREHVDVSMRHADVLPEADRHALWRQGEQCRRIYALAEAEARADAGQRLLWQRLLHDPRWLADATYREALLNGARHAPAPGRARPAA